MPTMKWTGNGIRIIDQTRLPSDEIYLDLVTLEEVCEAIGTLRVRGAPALGIIGAMGLALAARIALNEGADVMPAVAAAAERLRATRPTAVNLGWALDRVLDRLKSEGPESPGEIFACLEKESLRIHAEDLEMSRAMGRAGAAILPSGARILTHCNTGGLATGGLGTALDVAFEAHLQGKNPHVFADETRPLLQGARLNAWELKRNGIPVTVQVDGAAPWLIKSRGIDIILYGADRIARNGDTANKIGSYMLSLAAQAHKVPLYVVAPTSSFDSKIPDGEAIPIEDRGEEEVTLWGGRRTAPEGIDVFNPAFDITPATHITGWITEGGILQPPFTEKRLAAARSSMMRGGTR
ncbi:MAG: S-methyl-5-thioribose-1-phosphate isomerase [Candidatus Eisenbacteria bacterium]|uniref:Methylthioribose-1-phosphate isomerase n=1 Tax=Eiseniibacteriota bacterium TaxID=2212470 RepID=A0A948RYE7_UNCEI|nr:S-methyl-5-thioribose-1-phosphate isomerase [Candidatus Eisenbacteria bacterium]